MAQNSVAESGQSGSDHPGGAPIIHSTNEGFRRRPVDGFPAADGGPVVAPREAHSWATSESVVPGLKLLAADRVGAVLLRLLREPPSTGVGKSFVTARPSSFPVGPGLRSWPSFGIPCGVGRRLVTVARKLGPQCWPSADCSLSTAARGVGSSAATASCNIGPPVRLAPETSVPPFTRAIGVGNSHGEDPVTQVRGAEGGSR
jgi:hypothetical protein